DGQVVVVAEAIGEHAYDGIATRTIAAFVERLVSIDSRKELEARLRSALEAANVVASVTGDDSPARSSGAVSLAALVFADGDALALNIGNPRWYGWRDGSLGQLTRDHCALSDLPDDRHAGKRSGPFARHYRNLLTQSLGSPFQP